MTKHALATLAVAALAVALLAGGCGKPTTAPPAGAGAKAGPATAAAGAATATPSTTAAAPGGKVQLTLFTWVREDELAANEDLLKIFEKEHPDISVRIVNVSGSTEAMAKLHTMTAGGEPPDVASIHGAFFYSFAASGALADLAPFIAKDKSFNLADFNPRIVKMCRWKGKLYSLPRYTSLYALFYNKDLFDAAGVPYPPKQGPEGKGDWTWADYLKTVRALTIPGPQKGEPTQYGCYIDFWGSRIFPWLWQNDANLMNADRTKLALDTPQAAQSIQFLVNLRQKYDVTPAPTPGEQNEGLSLFIQGRVATYMSGPWDVEEIRQGAQFNWDIWHLPKKKVRATMLGTENYAIMAGTKHPKESWELFKFLLSPKSQTYMAEKQEKMPSRISVLKGPYLKQKVEYDRRVFVDALDYAKQPPNIPQWDKVAHLIQEELDLIWIGKVPVAQGLKTATQNVDAMLTQMAQGGA